MPDQHPISAGDAQYICEKMHEGVVIQGKDGVIRAFNNAALRVLAMSADQLLGKASVDPEWMAIDTRMQPFPGERHPAMRCLEHGVAQLGVIMGVRTPEGLRWVQIDSYPRETDGERTVLTIFTDVTAQQQADDDLRQRLRVLQDALLPSNQRVARNLRAASWYRAAGGRFVVGGDFFDIVDVDNDSIFFIGDIAGHGVEALAATALARYTLRAAAVQGASPAAALRLLHDSLVAEGGGHLCTALYGRAVVHPDHLQLSISSAGHPRPLVVSPSGNRAVGGHGPLLGTNMPWVDWHSEDVVLRSGEQLFCYTDGLTDTVRPRLDDELLAGIVTLGKDPADTIEATLRAVPGTWVEAADDIAVLVVAPPLAPHDSGGRD